MPAQQAVQGARLERDPIEPWADTGQRSGECLGGLGNGFSEAGRGLAGGCGQCDADTGFAVGQ